MHCTLPNSSVLLVKQHRSVATKEDIDCIPLAAVDAKFERQNSADHG